MFPCPAPPPSPPGFSPFLLSPPPSLLPALFSLPPPRRLKPITPLGKQRAAPGELRAAWRLRVCRCTGGGLGRCEERVFVRRANEERRRRRRWALLPPTSAPPQLLHSAPLPSQPALPHFLKWRRLLAPPRRSLLPPARGPRQPSPRGGGFRLGWGGALPRVPPGEGAGWWRRAAAARGLHDVRGCKDGRA